MDNRLMLTIITLLILLGSFVGAATIDYVSPPTPSDGEIISSDSTTIKVNLLDVSNLNNLNFTFDSVTTSMLLNSDFGVGKYSFGPSDGLVLYLPFEGGSLTNLGSASGTATNVGATQTTGKLGDAYSFNGVNNYIGVANLIIPNNVTYVLWIKPSSLNNNRFLSQLGGNDVGDFNIRINDAEGHIRLLRQTGVGTNYEIWATTNLKVNVNDWNYIAVNYDGTNVIFYINGETETPSKSTGSYDYGSQGIFKIGEADSTYFNGTIDEVRVYNRTLSELEIKDLYNSHLQKVSSTSYVLEVNKTGLALGEYSYSVSLNDADGVSTSGLKTFEYLGPQRVSFVSPPTPADLATVPTNEVTIKANLTELLNVNKINFTFNSVTTSMLITSSFPNGHYSFGPSDGLVLYLPFEGGSLTNLGSAGGSIANNGAISTTGKIGDAYLFGGTTQELRYTDGSVFSPGLGSKTWSFWAKGDGYPIGHMTSSDYYGFIIVVGDSLMFYVKDLNSNMGAPLITINSITNTNDFFYYTFVWDKEINQLKIYVDGNLKGNRSISQFTNVIGTGAGMIGTGYNNLGSGSGHFNGLIDEVRVYDRALTDSEIKILYNSHLEKVSSTNFVLQVNKTDLEIGAYNYSVSLNDDEGVSTSGLKTFEYLGPQKVSFVSPTPDDLATIPTNEVTIKANLVDLVNLNKINFTFNSVTTSMLLNSNFGVGEYSFGPSDGLVLYLPFEDGSLTDLSGQGNDATNNGATQTTGKLGDAYSFNGASSYLEISDNLLLKDVFVQNNKWTVTYWGNYGVGGPTSGVGSYSPSFSRYTIGFCGVQLQDSVGRLRATDGINSLNELNGFGQNLADTGWRYITLTYNGSVFDVYIDGVYSKSTDWIYGIADCSTSLYLGKNTWSNYMNGSLDDFRIYNRALTESEIKDLYNSQLQKVSSTSYVLEVNKTGLALGEYSYSVSLNDADGVSTSGLKTFEYLGPQRVSFVSPTPENASEVIVLPVSIKVNVSEVNNLNALNFTFNNVNYRMFDNSVVLKLNLNNNSIIGETSTKVVSFDNRINGTITGATWTSSGKYGSALYFDGTGDYVDLGTTNVLCPLNFSVELWMKPSSFVGSNPSTAFSKWDVSNTGFFLRKANSATPYYFYIGDGSGGWGTGYIAIDTGTMTEEQWHHVIGTYNGSKLILYVDGAQVSSYDWNKYTCSTAKFYVGTYGPDISQVFQGAIDEVIMYNRSLSADEVAFNYNSNLYKYNSTNFVLEINKTNLEVGEYNYSVILEDDEGVSTSSRTFDYLGPQLTTFLSPTPSNNETIGNNSVIINATISSSNLTNVIFNWEGQNVNLTPYLSSSNYNSFYYSGNGSNVTPWIKGNGLRDCQAYLKYYNKGSGIYYINPTKGNYSSIYRVYCDMTTDNGGWTLVASGWQTTTYTMHEPYSSLGPYIIPGTISFGYDKMWMTGASDIPTIVNRTYTFSSNQTILNDMNSTSIESVWANDNLGYTPGLLQNGGYTELHFFNPSVQGVRFIIRNDSVHMAANYQVTGTNNNLGKWAQIWVKGYGLENSSESNLTYKLIKLNNTHYNLIVNITDLVLDTEYSYSVLADDDNTSSNTGTRTFIYGTVNETEQNETVFVNLTSSFVSPPTPVNTSEVNDYNFTILANIDANYLYELIFNWKGENYFLYDYTTKLKYDLNNNEIIGETVIKSVDSSLHSINGTIYGATWVDDALYFDGSDRLEIDNYNELILGNNFTINIWIEGDNENSASKMQTLISKWETNASGFSDSSSWEYFDATTLNDELKGYVGAGFDGKYIYFIPYYDGTYKGTFLRYDVTQDFDNSNSWEYFDTESVNEELTGYRSAIFDGKYMYFVPYTNDFGRHGNVLRYDTTQDFDNSNSWDSFDPSSYDSGAQGFLGASFDGKYIYFAPYHDGSSTSGLFVRYNTEEEFNDISSWDSFNAKTINSGLSGYYGGIYDGQYIYFIPNYGDSRHGKVLRYNTNGNFMDQNSWEYFDASTINTGLKGFIGGTYDGRYVYFTPHYDATNNYHGKVLRYDTTQTFTSSGSWTYYDLATLNTQYKGYYGGIFDGEYIYLIPDQYGTNTANKHGRVARYNVNSPFTSSGSWDFFDASVINSGLKGFFGGTYDGRYVYFAPYHDGLEYSGKVLRYDTTGDHSSFKLSYSPNDLSGSFSSNILGVSFTLNSDDKIYTLVSNEIIDEGKNLITIKRENENIKLYVNGIQKDSIEFTGTINPSDTIDLILGSFYEGKIYDFTLFNRTLSDDEILFVYDMSLYQNNSTNWKLNITKQNLDLGVYNYSIYVSNGTHNFSTGLNTFEIVGPATQKVNLISPPSPSDGETIYTTSVNLMYNYTSISNLNEITLNFNGTDYIFYDDSLILKLNLDNNDYIGETLSKVKDTSLNAIEGSVSGPAQTQGKYYNAYYFDGENDKITFSNFDVTAIQNDFTISLWVDSDTLDVGSLRNLISKWKTNSLGFVNSDNWESYDAGNVLGTYTRGYRGGVFDGRYIYFVPYYDTSAPWPYNHGRVLRYDTYYPLNSVNSWQYIDLINIGPNLRGYTGGTFDGNYVYFVPYYDGSTRNGKVVRYDITKPFNEVDSWSYFDASILGNFGMGFQGAVFDGQHIYFVPHYSGVGYNGNVVRYDTTQDFSSTSSWSNYDASNVGTHTKGFMGAVFDGKHIYFVPYHDGVRHGEVLRYDTTQLFTNSSSWLSFDMSTINSGLKGFYGGTFDGRYVYFSPHNDGSVYHGKVARYDTQNSFTDASSWSYFDAGNIGTNTKGYSGALFDGQYVYFVPHNDGVSNSGKVLRYDSTQTFTESSSWLSFDAGSIGTNTKGHMGAVFDGRNIYFVPYYDGTIYSGKVLKYDTTGEESSFKLVYSEAGQSGAFAGSPFGLNFYFSSGSYVYNLPLNEKLGYGWNHIVITRKDDVMRMYVNGILKNSKPVYGTINPFESVDLIIGNFQGNYGFKGVIDEVNIYNRSFNENEIVMEYNSNLRKFSDNNYVLNTTLFGLLPGEYSYYSKINDDGTLYVGEERTFTFDASAITPVLEFTSNTIENGTYSQRTIPIEVQSNYDVAFSNITINLYKNGVLYDTAHSDTLPFTYEFDDLKGATFTFNATGYYFNEKISSPSREIVLNTCTSLTNGQTYTLSSNEYFEVCPGTYSNVKFYINSLNVLLDCNGAQFNGLGTSGAGYGLEIREYAQNLEVRNCKFHNYARAAYIYGTSAKNIENLYIYNSSFTRSYYDNMYIYYLKNSLFEKITVANETSASASYHNINFQQFNNIDIKDSLIADNSGEGIYAITGQILNVQNTTFLNNRYAFYVNNINSNANSYSTIKDNYFSGISNSIRSESSYRLNVYNNLFRTTSVYVRDNVATHIFNTTLDCSQKNIIDGPCIGGNYWYNNIIPDLNEDGFGDYAYNNTYLTDSLPLKQLLHFVNPTYPDWVNSHDLLDQSFIPINLTSYYNEDFTNVTLYLYKNGVLYEEVEVDTLPFSHTFTSLGTGNYIVNSTGYYEDELREGETRTFILGDCFTPTNNTYYTFIANENIHVCPGNYTYVRFYTNSPNVNINCNNANMTGLGSSGQGIQLGASASNVNITNCNFRDYSRGLYAYGTSLANPIRNMRVENSNFSHNYHNGIYLYYVADSIFNNLDLSYIYASANSYGPLSTSYLDNVKITNNLMSNSNGTGFYIASTSYDVLIENNTIDNNKYEGVYIGSLTGLEIINNSIRNSQEQGIQLSIVFGSIIRNNVIYNSKYEGIYLSSGGNHLIENNDIRNNRYHGLYFTSVNSNAAHSSIIRNNYLINNGIETSSYYGYYTTSTYRNYFYNNYVQSSGNRNVFIQHYGNTHYFSTTKDCNITNIAGGPCIGGNYWSNYETSTNHIEDVDEDGFGDVSYTARPTNSQLVTDTLPLTDRLLYFVSPTPQSWVNSREYLDQDYINVNISSYYKENFTNVTLNLYKENVLIDTIQTNNLSYYHEFTSLETGNYKITLTGTYNGELVEGEERIIILGDCYYPINNSYVTLASNENFKMCPGEYSYVRLYTNGENVNIDCNGATVIGTGSSGQGIQLGSSADNVNVTNCHFEAYSYGFYAYGTSQADKIGNIRIENSTFSNNYNSNIYVYYVKDSSFNNITALGIKTTGASDTYSSMYSFYCDTLNITNSVFKSERGSGLYLYGYSGTPYGTNNIVENCTFNSNLYYGANIFYNDGLIFRNNEIKSNQQHGLYLYEVRNALIENNDIRSNRYHGIYMRYCNTLASSSSIVRGNYLISNGGISTSYFGLRTESSYRNYIYNNYFQNSGNRNIYVANNGNTHYFNVAKDCSERNIVFGECIGGNYWNTYSGVDANADGIGDTVYTTQPSGSQLITDNLPLMKSYVVDSCGTITLAGEHYVLSDLNAGATSPCITINGNGITLNLYGNTITNSDSGPTILVNNSDNVIIHNGNIQGGTYNEEGSIYALNSDLHVMNINFNNIDITNENAGVIYSNNSELTLTNTLFNNIEFPLQTEDTITFTNLTMCNSSNTNCIKWLSGSSLNGIKPILGENILIGYETVSVDPSDSRISSMGVDALITLSTDICPVSYVKYNGLTLDLQTIIDNGEIYKPDYFTCGAGKTTFLTNDGFSSYGLTQVDRDFEILDSLEFIPLNPKEGDSISITGTLNSTLVTPTNVRVGLIVDGSEVDYTNVNVIENGTTSITLSFTPLVSKEYNVQLSADSNDAYIELDELNNAQNVSVFVLRSAEISIVYPLNDSLIIRGKNQAGEDTYRLVNDYSNITAFVSSLNGSEVNSTCYFYVNGTLINSNSTINGTCYVMYDKTISLLGDRNLSVNFTINEANTTYSNNPFSSILQTLVVANGEIIPSNYRDGLIYRKGDAVITNVLTYYDNSLVDVDDFKLFIGGSAGMACPHYSLPDEGEAWFVLTKSDSTINANGNYTLSAVLDESHDENIHWCFYAYDDEGNIIISTSHQDISIQDADSTLQFNITDGLNNPLNSNVLILDRNGETLLSTSTSNVSRPVVIGDSHNITISNSGDTIKFNELNIDSSLVSFKTSFITYNGIKPFTGTGSITKMLYLTNESELDYSSATLYFQKNVDSRIVYKCNDYNYIFSNCSDWEIYNSPLNQNSNSTHIWFSVNDFSGYLYGPEQTYLNVWDNGDTGMPFAEEYVRVNRSAYFYANFTDSNLNPLSGSTCTINFGSGNVNMNYNSGTGYYTYTRTFNTQNVYSYTINCNKNGYTALTETDDISVTVSPPPYIEDISITPDIAYKNTSITCTGTIYDVDDSSGLTIQFVFMNGTTELYSTSYSSLNSGTTRSATMTSNYFTKDMNVTCKIRGTDSTAYGSYYESLGVPVENSVPIWANPIDLIEVNTSSIGSFTLICTDPDEDFVYYSLQNNLSGMLSINGSELQWLKWDESNKSTHLISINCSDTFSNVSKEFTYNISDTTLPLYSNAVNTSTEINRFENVTFNVTFSDYFPNKVYFMYAEGVEDYSSIIFDWVNQTQTFSVTRNVTTIPGLNNTYYWIGFDESYNENTTSIIDFSVINRNPILIENIPNKIVNMTQEYEINLSNYFTDSDLEPLTYSVDSKSSNNLSVSINGDVATVSALTLEFEWVIFRATDNSEGFVNSNVVDILVMNNPPVWVNPTDIINANSSSAGSFTLLCDDPEFEVVSFNVNTTLGDILSINGNELEWLKWDESNKSTYTILINCSDFFSNVSKEFTYNISDTTSPTYSNIENTSSEIYRFENVTFTGTFNDYFPSKVYFMYDEGAGSFSEIEFDWTEQEETFSVTRNVTTVPGELNKYYWRAVDESDNEINTSTTEFSVLNKAPILYLEIPNKIVNMTQEYEINLSNYFTDYDLEPLTYSVNSKSSNNLSVNINNEIATVSALTLEFEWVIFRATDNSESFVNSNTMEIYVFNQPPVWVNPTDIINVNSSSAGSFTLLCTDPESKPLSFTINDTLNEMLSINGSELQWDKWDESNKSTHIISINCSDFFTNVTEIFTYNILDTTSPTYSNIENTSSAIYRFENVTFTGTFNDYFPSKVYFMYDEGTGSFSEIEFDWIEQEETFSVTRNVTTVPGELNRYYWRAVDESDNVNVTSTIEFNVINSEPVFTGTIPSFTINENENREIILSNYFTDADLETLTYSVDSKSSNNLITTISSNKVTIRSSVPGFEWVILRATDSASSYVNSNKIDVSILRIPQAPIISNVEVNGISSVSDSGTQALGLLSLSDNQMRIFSDLPEVTDLDVVTITGEVISEDVSSLSCTTSSDESTLDDLPVNLIVGTPNTFSFTTYLIPSGIHDVDIICQDDFGITSLLSSIKVSLYPTDLLINPETIEVIPNNPNVGQQVAGFFSINNSGIRDATDVRVDLYVNNVNKGYIIVPSVPSGETVSAGPFFFTLDSSGYHNIQFVVDRFGNIPEFDDTNNEVTKLVLAGRTDQVDLITIDNIETNKYTRVNQQFHFVGPAYYDLPLNDYPVVQGGTTVINFNGVDYNGYSDREGNFPGIVITAPSEAGEYPVEVYVSDGNVQGNYSGSVLIYPPEIVPVVACEYPYNLPNLTALYIAGPGGSIIVGNTYTFTLYVRNGNSCNSTHSTVPGIHSSSVPIIVSNGSNTIYSVNRVDSLSANQYASYTFTMPVTKVGLNTLILSINGDRVIPELNYADNYVTYSFNAIEPLPPAEPGPVIVCPYSRLTPSITVSEVPNVFIFKNQTVTVNANVFNPNYISRTYTPLVVSLYEDSDLIGSELYASRTYEARTSTSDSFTTCISDSEIGSLNYNLDVYGIDQNGCLSESSSSRNLIFVESADLAIDPTGIEYYPTSSTADEIRVTGVDFKANISMLNKGNLPTDKPFKVAIKAYRVSYSWGYRVLSYHGEHKVEYDNTLNGFTGNCGDVLSYDGDTIEVTYPDLTPGRYALFAVIDSDNEISEYYTGLYSGSNLYGNEYELVEFTIYEIGPNIDTLISSNSRTVRYMPTSFTVRFTNNGINNGYDIPYKVVYEHADGTTDILEEDMISSLNSKGGSVTKSYSVIPKGFGDSFVRVYYNYTYDHPFDGEVTVVRSPSKKIVVGSPEIVIHSEDIVFSADFAKPGDEINVTSYIRNSGPFTAYNVSSILSVNETEEDDDLTLSIDSGAYSIVRFNFTVNQTNHTLVQISANDDVSIYELNKGDNIASKVLLVYNESLQPPQLTFNDLSKSYISGSKQITSTLVDPDTPTEDFIVDFSITSVETTVEDYLFTAHTPLSGEMNVQTISGASFGDYFDTNSFSDGEYIFNVNTTDGEHDIEDTSILYVIDNTPPVVDIINPLDNTLIEGIIEINYTIIEINPLRVRWRYSNDGGSTWSTYTNLYVRGTNGPKEYNGELNSFYFDAETNCPGLEESKCWVEIYVEDLADNSGSDVAMYRTLEINDPPEPDSKDEFIISHEFDCAPGQLVVNVDSVKGNSVSSAAFTLYETDSNGNIIREIESGNLIGDKLTTNLDKEGNYLIKLSRNNFKNGRYYFTVDSCELPVSNEKLYLDVKFDCPNNILSGLLTNLTSVISSQQVEIYHGNKIYDFTTDSNGYGYISIENPGTYTFYVSREGYDLLLYDFNVNELCPEPIEPEEEDDESDDENDDEVIVEPEPPFEEIDDAPKSLFDRVLISLIPQLNIRSGCDGFYNEGIPLILCDLVWLILLVEAVLIGYFQRENKRKYMFVVMPIVPLLIALIILPVVGVLLGSIELGFSLYFYYRKKARDREEYERAKEEL